MNKEDYSAKDNIELIKQDQLSLSPSDLNSITIVDSSPKNINVVQIKKEEKNQQSIQETFCNMIIYLFMFCILIVVCGYLSMGILFAISYFKNDYTLFISNNCISILSPCFFVGSISVIFCFIILSSIYFACK
tara:strand:+ start:110 stop:508 length:399 start_codon:yes stop_codon:yes gene_type:complete